MTQGPKEFKTSSETTHRIEAADRARTEVLAKEFAAIIEAQRGPEGSLGGREFGSVVVALSWIISWLFDQGYSEKAQKRMALQLFTKNIAAKLEILDEEPKQ